MDRRTSIPTARRHTRRSVAWLSCSERAGGNAMIGRELYPLLKSAGFGQVHVSPRMVYVDGSKPELVDGFTKRTFTAMIEGVRESALEAGIVDQHVFDRGIRDLGATTESNGVFCYTFFKAVAYHHAPSDRLEPTGA